MSQTDFLPLLTADVIRWERILITVAGRASNIADGSVDFYLSNENGERLKLTDAIVSDGRFAVRFNIVTVYTDRTCLPDGRWELLAVSKDTAAVFPVIAGEKLFSDVGRDDHFVGLPREEKLARYGCTFAKSSSNAYSLIPAVMSGDRLCFDSLYAHPLPLSMPQHIMRSLKKVFGPLVNAILRGGFFIIYDLTKLLTAHKGNHVLFCSDSREELSGNLEFVYRRMVERGLDKQFKISFLFKKNVRARRSFGEKFRAPFALARADIILIDDFNPTIAQLKFKRGVKVIQLWHACGAFKTVGFSRLGKQGGPAINSRNHRAYTHAIASSRHVAPFYCEAFGLTPDMVYPTGVPRTDIFFDEKYRSETRAALYELVPQAKGKRVILFAPTFRGNGAKSGNYPLFKLDMNALAQLCRETNSVFIFKMHPFVHDKVVIRPEFSDCLIDLSAEREINDLLFITDLLITDYSSVVYEASLLNIPMLFFAWDLEAYISTRDFYEPFESFVPGKIVRTFDELVKAIVNEDYEQEKVLPFCKRNFEFRDGHSTDRVIDWLLLGQEGEYSKRRDEAEPSPAAEQSNG